MLRSISKAPLLSTATRRTLKRRALPCSSNAAATLCTSRCSFLLPSATIDTDNQRRQFGTDSASHHIHYSHQCRPTNTSISTTQSRSFSSVFVSRHNQSLNVTSNTILEYCQNHGISTQEARQNTTHVILRECPFCHKPTHDKADNLYKLHVLIGGGAFFCHRCGTGGSWYDFKARLGGYSVDRGMSSSGGGNAAATRGSGGVYNQRISASMSPTQQQHDRSPYGGGGGSYSSGGNSVGGGSSYGGGGGNGTNYGGHFDNPRQLTSTKGSGSNGNHVPCLPIPKQRLSGYYSSRLLDPQHQGEENRVLDYLLHERGLDRKTLRKYGVGRAIYKFPSDHGGYQDAECVTFPWLMRASDVQAQESLRGATFVVPDEKSADTDKSNKKSDTDESSSPSNESEAPTGSFVTRRIKARAVDQKSWQRLDPPGGGWGLFGLHTVPDDCTEIVLTEGEYDAMAVSQGTGLPAISLPNGCRSLPVQVLPLLERFEKIYLWMDNDGPGQEGAEKFAKKLGLNRSYIVQCLEAKDANEALLNNIDMKEVLEKAALVPHDRILTFEDLRSEVLHELLQPELYTGVPVPSLPKFTQIIKGFRRGELTVLTGPTGSGKTTFLGQVSLDLAEQGINFLWGSFEIKNTRLLHKLLKQFSRNGLPANTDAGASELLNALADRFQDLPLYFMKFHGGSDVDEVLDAMEYAVYVNDVEHIVLDNMQFMISRKVHKSSFDKFEVQDIAVEKFRKFATEHNVHVTLVVHPRKEDESSKLSISSFYGSAKATQEADTVLILQNDNNRRKYIDVRKNRFDGTLGTSPLYFQSKSGRYVEDENVQGIPKPRQEPKSTITDKDLEEHWTFPSVNTNAWRA